MKKGKIIILGVSLIVLIGLIIFASTKTLDDGHLRIEGIRVKVPNGTLSWSKWQGSQNRV